MSDLTILYRNGVVRRIVASEEILDSHAALWPWFWQGTFGMPSGSLPDLEVEYSSIGDVVDLEGDRMQNGDQDIPNKEIADEMTVPRYDEAGVSALISDLYAFGCGWQRNHPQDIPDLGDVTIEFDEHTFSSWRDRDFKSEQEHGDEILYEEDGEA